MIFQEWFLKKFTLPKVRFKHPNTISIDCSEMAIPKIFRKREKNMKSYWSVSKPFWRYFDLILNDIEGRRKKSRSCDDRQKASEPQLLHLLLWVPWIEDRLPNRHLLQTVRQSAYPSTSWGLNYEEKIHTHQPLLSKSTFLMIQDRIDALIKIYRPNVHPDYPNGGRFTPFLEAQEVGVKMMMEGPFGKFSYKPGGTVLISTNHLKKREKNTNAKDYSQ